MIAVKLRLILVGVAWVSSSKWAQCSKPDFNNLEDCKRQCLDSLTPTENPTEVNSEVSTIYFTISFRSCFNSKVKERAKGIFEIILSARNYMYVRPEKTPVLQSN